MATREYTVRARIVADTKDAERNTRALAAANEELNKKLADLKARYDAGEVSAAKFVRQQQQIERQLGRLNSSATEASTGIGRVGSSLVSSTAAMAAGAISLAALVSGLKSAVTASAEQEAALNRLRVALAELGPEAEGVVRALEEQANVLQQNTAFSDDAVNAAQARIAAFTNEEATIKLLTKASADLAAARNIDLVSASDTLIKAFIGEGTALKRLGIDVDGAAGSMERLESVARGVTEAFGGQAAAQLDTASGAFGRLRNALGEVAEATGDVATKSDTVRNLIDTLSSAFFTVAETVSVFTGETDEAAAAQERQAQAAQRQADAMRETEALLAAVSREAERSAVAFDAMADAQSREIAESDRFIEGLTRIGVRLQTDVNQEIERNNALVKQSAELLAAGTITLADYNRIQEAAAVSNAKLAGSTLETAAATGQLATVTSTATVALERQAAQAVISTRAFDELAAAMGRAAAVEAALAAGGQLVNAGTRIRIRGGSRLTSTPGLTSQSRQSRGFSNLGTII